MNKIFSILFLIAIAVTPVFAIENNNDSTMNINANYKTEVAPDRANIRFYVENSGMNVNDLKKKNDEIIEKTISDIKKEIGTNGTIKTIAFSVNNVYSYKDRVRIFQKYEVRNGFEVDLKDINKVSNVIDIAMKNGIKNIGGLNFYLHNSEEACNKSIVQAINIAKNRAKYISNATQIPLYKIKNVNPSCSLDSNYVSRRYYANGMKNFQMDSSESSSVSEIEAGKIKVSASVNMTYYLK